jgi:nucleoside-diphosphate-sugar epimerase
MHPNKIINEDIRTIVAADIDWKLFEDKTILITGANGFLPAYMLEVLLFLVEINAVRSLKVIALVRNKEKAEKRFAHLLHNKSLQFLVQDVCTPIQTLPPVHFVIHAASQASPKYYGVDPVGTLQANVTGTLNLCELARNHPVQSFLYFSSGAVYGRIDHQVAEVSETSYGYLDPLDKFSCYGEAKRMGETICISYMRQYGIPVKMVRPAHIYGPGLDLNDGRLFADFVRDVVNRRDIVMHSDGQASRSFCYLTDAAIAFFKVLLEGENGEAYNVANPSCEVTVLELAQKLLSLFPERHLQIIRQERTGKQYVVSENTHASMTIEKMQSLHWHPVVSVENGFYRTIKSFE